MMKGALESKPDRNILVTELQHYSWAYKDGIVKEKKKKHPTTLSFQILSKDCFDDGLDDDGFWMDLVLFHIMGEVLLKRDS